LVDNKPSKRPLLQKLIKSYGPRQGLGEGERENQIQGRIKYVHNERRKGWKRNIAKFGNK